MEISKSPQNHYKPLKNNLAQATGACLKSKVCNGILKIPAKPFQRAKTHPETVRKTDTKSSEERQSTPGSKESPKGSQRPESKEPPKGSQYPESKEPPKGSQRPESKEFRTKAPEQEIRRSKDKEDFYGT